MLYPPYHYPRWGDTWVTDRANIKIYERRVLLCSGTMWEIAGEVGLVIDLTSSVILLTGHYIFFEDYVKCQVTTTKA